MIFIALLVLALAALGIRILFVIYGSSGYDDEAVKRYQMEKMSK